MKKETILQSAKTILRVREINNQIRKLQEKVEALRKSQGGIRQSGIGKSAERHDLTVQIELADYLSAFAGSVPNPSLCEFNYETEIDGVKVRGVKQYFYYPAVFAGTLPTEPPTHVWATAQTETVWAAKSPVPMTQAELVQNPATPLPVA